MFIHRKRDRQGAEGAEVSLRPLVPLTVQLMLVLGHVVHRRSRLRLRSVCRESRAGEINEWGLADWLGGACVAGRCSPKEWVIAMPDRVRVPKRGRDVAFSNKVEFGATTLLRRQRQSPRGR